MILQSFLVIYYLLSSKLAQEGPFLFADYNLKLLESEHAICAPVGFLILIFSSEEENLC